MTTVFLDGTVLVDPAPAAESPRIEDAIAFQDGRVIAHGGGARALALTEGATVVNLQGGTLAPAPGEGHAHPLLAGLELLGPDLTGASSIEEILAAVKEWKEANPDAEWIRGASYDSTLAPGGEFDAAWLDEVTGDTPTILRSWDYHTAWVNSAALRAGGITGDTPDPHLGRYVRRADGSVMGTLQESAANNFIADVVPPFTLEERVWALEKATLKYIAQGTTWVQDAWVDPENVDVYLEAAAAGRLHTRLNLAFRADPVTWREQLSQFPHFRDSVREIDCDNLTGNTVKFFLDGVIESHTAALIEPYADRPGDHGIANWEMEELVSAMRAFTESGFQLHIHAIGDAANRSALDGLEQIRDVLREDLPPVIAHVAMVHPEDVERFAALGVIANFEPYWSQCDSAMQELTIPHIGEEREHWQYLIGSLLRSGTRLSFGSDWPVSTPDWRLGFATAIERRDVTNPDDASWLPDERISAREAYAAYTAGNAQQALTSERGTLEIGQVADAVWLSHNPIDTAPSSIPDITVRGTWISGERVFTPANQQ